MPGSPEPQGADELAVLLASPWQPSLASGLIDPVVRHLESLDMHRMLDELSDAVACDYGIALEVRCRSSPRLMATIYTAELVDRGHVTPSHPALQRAGAALDQVSSETQLQILAWMLQRRGVSVEATALVEGVLAMREQGANQAGVADAGPMADVTGAGAPPPVEPGPWEPPGNQWPGFYIGNSAHKVIAEQYEARHRGDVVLSNYYSIRSILKELSELQHTPRTRSLTGTDLGLEPDIVNLTRLHLYEIKPAKAQAEGAAKARLEVGIFGRAGIAMQLGPVGEPGTEGGLPAPDGVFMFRAIQPGVIVYEYRKGRLVPVPVPVGERSRAGERRWRFELEPMTREQQQAVTTTTLGGALLIVLMVLLAPVGA